MRPSVRVATAATAALLLAVGVAAPRALAEPPSPGAPSAGDRLFPGIGNGGYNVQHYDIDFDYDAKTKMVDAKVSIAAKATQALSRFNLDFGGNTIERVTVDGRVADYRRDGEELVVTPAKPLRHLFRVDVTYRADPQLKDACTLVPPLEGTAWIPTKDGFGLAGQPNCMHTAYPSNDIPSDKATYTISVATPEKLESVANGELTSVTTNQGKVIRTFDATDPIATELVQIAVGDFGVFEHKAEDGTPLRDIMPRTMLAKAKPQLATQEQHIPWMNREVGVDYPLQNYGSLGLRGEFGFALETQTISLYEAPWLTESESWLQGLMVHELAHQWFGDYVSPATWSDLWLNEGHATWYEIRYMEEVVGEGSLRQAMKETYQSGDQYRKDYGPVAKPKNSDTLFSDNVYSGGALVLYALRQKVGDDTFRAIERQWVTEHANGVAGTDDFITLASRVSGQDLRGFLEAWLYGTETPPMPGHAGWTVDPPSAERTKLAPPHTHRHLRGA